MINTEWKTDTDTGVGFLECKKEEFGNEPRENRTDIVKVYFDSDFDAPVVKYMKIEPLIAKEIFRNRKIFASEVDAWLEITERGIYLHTSATIFLNRDIMQSIIRETKGGE